MDSPIQKHRVGSFVIRPFYFYFADNGIDIVCPVDNKAFLPIDLMSPFPAKSAYVSFMSWHAVMVNKNTIEHIIDFRMFFIISIPPPF